MRRKPIGNDRPARNGGVADVKPSPWQAPTKGLITAASLTAMDPASSTSLSNWFPEAGYVRSRNGCIAYGTGFTAEIDTLIPYFGPTTNTLFAFSNGNIYDVTSAGAIGSPVFTGNSSNIFSYAELATGGGNFLWAACPGQAPIRYDGTTWVTTSLTQDTGFPWGASPSMTAANLQAVVSYGSRLYFIEANSTRVWVGPTLGISTTMALGLLDLGPNLQFGGNIAAMGVWNLQTVSGPIQHIVFVSTNGEILIWQGTDPTDSTNWGMLAQFKLSPPLGGMRGLTIMGADLAITTIDGIISVSKAFSLDPAFVDQAALTAPIAPTWLNTMNSNGITNTGFINSSAWQVQSFPHKRMLVVNVPDENGIFQYVMNSETSAWTTFTGWQIQCMTVFENVLYYGGVDNSGNFAVFQAETGGNDNGQVINCIGYTAWDYGDGMTWRNINTVSVIAQYTSGTTIYLDNAQDFSYPDTNNVASTLSASTGAIWDTSDWDHGMWAGLTTARFIAGVNSNPGFSMSIIFKASINGSTSIPSNCIILSGAYTIEGGGFI